MAEQQFGAPHLLGNRRSHAKPTEPIKARRSHAAKARQATQPSALSLSHSSVPLLRSQGRRRRLQFQSQLSSSSSLSLSLFRYSSKPLGHVCPSSPSPTSLSIVAHADTSYEPPTPGSPPSITAHDLHRSRSRDPSGSSFGSTERSKAARDPIIAPLGTFFSFGFLRPHGVEQALVPSSSSSRRICASFPTLSPSLAPSSASGIITILLLPAARISLLLPAVDSNIILLPTANQLRRQHRRFLSEIANTRLLKSRMLQVSEASKLQMEVQKQLHEQLEVQRQLQQRIEAQGKYLKKIIEEQQRLSEVLTETPGLDLLPPPPPCSANICQDSDPSTPVSICKFPRNKRHGRADSLFKGTSCEDSVSPDSSFHADGSLSKGLKHERPIKRQRSDGVVRGGSGKVDFVLGNHILESSSGSEFQQQSCFMFPSVSHFDFPGTSDSNDDQLKNGSGSEV